MRLPRRIAHRGASALAPENTLAALKLAAELGATWVEFDVALTADDEVVVIHDATLNRTTDATGFVRSKTLRQLNHCDAGSWFSPAFAGERIPTLQQWLELAIALGLRLNIECKCAKRDAQQLVARVKRVLSMHPRSIIEQWLLSSGQWHCVREFCSVMPSMQRALIDDTLTDAGLNFAKHTDCVSLNLDQRKISAEHVKKINRSGRGCLVWTANNARRINHLYTLGVDGVFSDVVEPSSTGELLCVSSE